MRNQNLFLSLALVSLALASSSAFAGKSKETIRACLDEKNKSLDKEDREIAKYSCRASRAAQVLKNATFDSKAIDRKLAIKMIAEADCILVFPRVKSGGVLFIGASWGQGVFSCVQDDGSWSDPRFVSTKNIKFMFGLPVEATKSDYVMIVHGEHAGERHALKDRSEVALHEQREEPAARAAQHGGGGKLVVAERG
jgi:hypothetical protein